jgi:thiol:disulfide interchange protein DsbC
MEKIERMKSRTLILVIVALVALLPLSVSASVKDVAESLRRDYPKLDFQQVTPGPVDGIYQVVAGQSEIVYYVPATGYLLTGEFWTRDAQNLTQQAKADLMTEKAGLFPLDKAVVIGKGPQQVIEVVDPDCPYCREGSAFFAGRTDVTRYIFLFPLDIHPQSEAKAAYILSSSEQAVAYEEVMGGAFDTEPLPKFKDNGLLREHQLLGQQLGIHGTPKYWVNGRFVAGSNLQQMEKMLGGKKN